MNTSAASTTSPTVTSQQAYYDDYWRTHKLGLNSHEVLRLAEILAAIGRLLPDLGQRELRICDLGCGRGWLSAELAKFGSVTSVDLSPQAVAAASSRWPHVRFQVADILSWRPDETFDLVVSSEVIEHVPDHERFAATVAHLLRDGGYLVLTTPNGAVKAAWDAENQGQQMIENWLTMPALRRLFGRAHVLAHKVFILDFSYARIYRLTSAPKVLKLVRALGLGRFYDYVREGLGMGLYQIIVARFGKERA